MMYSINLAEMERKPQSAELMRLMEVKFANIERRISKLESQIGNNQTWNHETAANSPIGCQLACKVTAIAGLQEAFLSEHRRTRYIWTLLFCLGVGATVFYLYQTADEYRKHPTATTIQISNDSQHSFLPLLICPPVWFDVEKASNLGLSMDALKYSLSYLSNKFYQKIANVSRAKNEFLSIYTSHNFNSLLDYYSYIAPDIEHGQIDETSGAAYTCRGCIINSKPEKTILDRSVCYMFLLKAADKAFGTYSGIRSLRIKFTDRTFGMVPYSPDWFLYFKYPDNTFVSMRPKVSVRVSHHNTVKFDKYRLCILNKPHAPCNAEHPNRYSFAMCTAVCHNQMYKKFINCGLIWFSPPSSKPSPPGLCNYADKLPKNYSLAEFFASEDNARIDADAADRCGKRCPVRCRRIVFSATLQMQTRFTDADMEWVADAENRNVSYVEIILKHGAVYQGGFTIFDEMHTYSFTQLVNNVGGALGLFVGATVMTFAQLISFAVGRVFRKVRMSSMITSRNGHSNRSTNDAQMS